MIPLVAPDYNDADRAAIAEAAAHLEHGEAYVARLEARLAEHFSAAGAVCTTSGTAALHLALTALHTTVTHTPSYTCQAVLNACQAKGVSLLDNGFEPERLYYDTSNEHLLAALAGTHNDEHETAVIPAMFGQDPFYARIQNGCHLLGVHLIEDRAMMLGEQPTTPIFGSCAVLSFHESKIISAQHGGAVVTNDPDLLTRMRDLNGYADAVVADRLNDSPTYQPRVNYRMSGLNAALALSQMDRLDEFVARRAKIAAYYNDRLKDAPAILPTKVPVGSIYGRYVMALANRHPVDAIKALEAHGIEAGRGCWPLLHRYLAQPPDNFPNAEKAGRTVLSLPCYPALHDSEVEVISDAARIVLCP